MRVNIINHGSLKEMGWKELIFRLKKLDWRIFSFMVNIFCQHGLVLKTRGDFWDHLFKLARKKPIAMLPFLSNCAFFDDLDEHLQVIRKNLQSHARII
jgi:hypothetical protein